MNTKLISNLILFFYISPDAITPHSEHVYNKNQPSHDLT